MKAENRQSPKEFGHAVSAGPAWMTTHHVVTMPPFANVRCRRDSRIHVLGLACDLLP
jgi:hypothetical protein